MKGDELICLLRTRDDLCKNEKERSVCKRKRMQKLMLYREQDSTQDTTLQNMWQNTTRLTTFQDMWHNTTRLGQTRDKQNKIDSSHSSTLVTEEYKRLDDTTRTLHSASQEHSTLHQKNNNLHHKNKNSLNIQEQYNIKTTRTRTLQEQRRTHNLNMKQNREEHGS